MSKPTKKSNWVSGGEATRIKEPSASKKLTGWKKKEKPPFNFLNWVGYIRDLWINYLAGNAQYNIIIDSGNVDEADYATFAAYLADSPSNGDKILIKTSEAVSGELDINNSIEITQLPEAFFNVSTNFTPIVRFDANEIITHGPLKINNTDTGTIGNAYVIDGKRQHHDNLQINMDAAGTLTNAIGITAGSSNNYARGVIFENLGTVTNYLNDVSANFTNDIIIRGDSQLIRSDGQRKYDHLIFTDGADVASAATLPLIDDGNYNDVTGVATITAFAAVDVGTIKILQFGSSLTLTHHATNLILPEGQDIVTQPGDVLTFFEYASGDWRLISGSNIGIFSKVGVVTRDTSLVSGTQEITGVGFKPKAVLLLMNQPSTTEASWGLDDGTTPFCIFDIHQTVSDEYSNDQSFSINDRHSTGNTYQGKIDSLDADGFTIDWVKTGAPTGTIIIGYLAIR